jgi:tetratricopeptide (TPR) repeat protein
MRTIRHAAPAVAKKIRTSISAPFGRLLLAVCVAGIVQPGVAQPLPTPVTRSVEPAISLPYDAALGQYRAGNRQAALEILDRALQIDARDIRLRFLRGVVLTELGQFEPAIQMFRALIADFPELPEPYNNLAVLHAGQGDLDAALRALLDAVRALPTYALAHENLGDLYLRLAGRSYEQARTLDPANASAASKLVLTSELIGRIQPPAATSNPR